LGANAAVFEGKRGSGTVTCEAVHVGSAAASGPSVYISGTQWPSADGSSGQLLSTDGNGQLQWISGGSASGSTFDSLTVDGWIIDTQGTDWTLAPPNAAATPVVRVSTAGDLTAHSVTTISDRSLKENIYTLDAGRAAQLLQQLQPVRFTWKSTGQPAYGFVAQEVARIAPHLVQVQPQDGLHSIKTLELVPLLVAEVQDLRRQLQDLRASLA